MSLVDRRAFIVRLCLGLVVLTVVGLALRYHNPSAAFGQTTNGATLLVVAPAVEVSIAGGAFVAATSGQTLAPGDQVRTDDHGVALITYFDGSETQVVGGTQVQLAAGVVGTFQMSGTTVNRVPPGQVGTPHQTDTAPAAAIVRGTTYVVTVKRLTSAPALLALPQTDATDTSGQQIASYPRYVPESDYPLLAEALYSDGNEWWDDRTWSDPDSGETWDTFDDLGPADQAPQTDDPLVLAFAAPPTSTPTPSQSPATVVPSNLCLPQDVSACLTSVILLADPDGRVGRVGVVAHAPGAGALELTAAGEIGAASGANLTRSNLLPAPLRQLQQTVLDLRDPAAAELTRQQADEVAREVAPATAPNLPPPPGPPGPPPGGLQQLAGAPQPVSGGTPPANNSTPSVPPPPPPAGQAISPGASQAGGGNVAVVAPQSGGTTTTSRPSGGGGSTPPTNPDSVAQVFGAGGGVISLPDGSASATIPAGAVPDNTQVGISRSTVVSPPAGADAASQAFQFTASDAGGAALGGFSQPVQVTVRYSGTDPNALAFFNQATGTWQVIPSTVQSSTSMITGTTSHFTLFAAFRNFPIPTSTPTPSPSATPTSTPASTLTATTTATATATASPTSTPTPTQTATPTATPTATAVPPPSDSFAAAPTFSAPAVVSGDVKNATLEPGEPQNTCLPIDRSLWYRVTAPHAGSLFLNLRRFPFSASLTLWSGSTLQNLQQVTCRNIDEPGTLLAPVQAGQSYFLQIGVFSGFSFTDGGFVLDANLDNSGEPDLASVVNQFIDHWVVQRQLDIPVEIQNRGSATAPPSKLGVYIDSPAGPKPGDPALVQVDVPSLAPGATTAVTGSLAAGALSIGTHTVAVQADAPGVIPEPDEANNVWTEGPFPVGNEPPNDSHGQPIQLAIPSSTTASNVFAIEEFSIQRPGCPAIVQRLSYSVTPAVTGTLSLTVTGNNFDTFVDAIPSTTLGSFVCGVTRAGQVPVPVQLPVVAGQSYRIEVASDLDTGGTTGTFTLNLAVNSAQGKAYVTNQSPGLGVAVVDLATDTVTRTIATGFHAQGATTNAAGTAIYAINSDGNSVSQIDPTTDTVVGTIPVGTGPVTGVVSPDGARLYVTNFGSGTVSVVDTATRTQINTLTVLSPWGVAISNDGATLAVTSYSGNTVSLFNTATLTLTRTVPVGLHPEGVLFNAAGDRLYVANDGTGTGATDGSMSVVNPSTGLIVATIPMQTPGELGRSPTTGLIYAAGASPNGVLYEVNPATNTVARTFPVGQIAIDVTVTGDGRFAYVTNDGSSSVSVIDLQTGVRIANIVGVSAPHSIIISGRRE